EAVPAPSAVGISVGADRAGPATDDGLVVGCGGGAAAGAVGPGRAAAGGGGHVAGRGPGGGAHGARTAGDVVRIGQVSGRETADVRVARAAAGAARPDAAARPGGPVGAAPSGHDLQVAALARIGAARGARRAVAALRRVAGARIRVDHVVAASLGDPLVR